MKVFDNELVVQRGETFTLSKIIENKDGSPYIISSELNEPYWLVTVASGQFDYEDRYICNKWLSLKNALRFYTTKPVNLNDMGYHSWSTTPLPLGYEGDKSVGYANYAVFMLEENGVKSYKYWKYKSNNLNNYDGDWVDYICYINTVFTRDVTKEWNEQNYLYSINLVDGVKIGESDAPLNNITLSYPILDTRKIYVKSDLNGGVL